MQLDPLSDRNLESVSGWMAAEENSKWLDFGAGVQILTPVALKVMMQREIHLIRVFTTDAEAEPLGIVGLSNITERFKTATLWYVLGAKHKGGRGLTSLAVSHILDLGFRQRGLRSVNAWVVESNLPSRRVLLRNGFRLIGTQRQCHEIDGQVHDRLLFDLLVDEYEGISHAKPR